MGGGISKGAKYKARSSANGLTLSKSGRQNQQQETNQMQLIPQSSASIIKRNRGSSVVSRDTSESMLQMSYDKSSTWDLVGENQGEYDREAKRKGTLNLRKYSDATTHIVSFEDRSFVEDDSGGSATKRPSLGRKKRTENSLLQLNNHGSSQRDSFELSINAYDYLDTLRSKWTDKEELGQPEHNHWLVSLKGLQYALTAYKRSDRVVLGEKWMTSEDAKLLVPLDPTQRFLFVSHAWRGAGPFRDPYWKSQLYDIIKQMLRKRIDYAWVDALCCPQTVIPKVGGGSEPEGQMKGHLKLGDATATSWCLNNLEQVVQSATAFFAVGNPKTQQVVQARISALVDLVKAMSTIAESRFDGALSNCMTGISISCDFLVEQAKNLEREEIHIGAGTIESKRMWMYGEVVCAQRNDVDVIGKVYVDKLVGACCSILALMDQCKTVVETLEVDQKLSREEAQLLRSKCGQISQLTETIRSDSTLGPSGMEVSRHCETFQQELLDGDKEAEEKFFCHVADLALKYELSDARDFYYVLKCAYALPDKVGENEKVQSWVKACAAICARQSLGTKKVSTCIEIEKKLIQHWARTERSFMLFSITNGPTKYCATIPCGDGKIICYLNTESDGQSKCEITFCQVQGGLEVVPLNGKETEEILNTYLKN